MAEVCALLQPLRRFCSLETVVQVRLCAPLDGRKSVPDFGDADEKNEASWRFSADAGVSPAAAGKAASRRKDVSVS